MLGEGLGADWHFQKEQWPSWVSAQETDLIPGGKQTWASLAE